jgi:hypothetical protein
VNHFLQEPQQQSVSGRGEPIEAVWPPGSAGRAAELQRLLTIEDRHWHALKRQRPRRAAEQLAAALVVLLSRDQPDQAAAGEARREAVALVEHALGWLKAEISDPGCPRHGAAGEKAVPG